MTVTGGVVNPRIIGEVIEGKCKSFDSAEVRFAEEDILIWGLRWIASNEANSSLKRQSYQPRAMTIAPAVISIPPTMAGGVSFSPSSSQAKTMTSGTLSLSSGATREAGPSWRARK